MTYTHRLLWYYCLLFAIACALAIDIFGIVFGTTPDQIGNDFAIFWAASRLPATSVYDFDLVSAAQSAIGASGLRPFVSPPTMLAWVAPFAALPFKAAFALWTALGLAIFYFAGRRLASRGAMLLALLSPAVIVGAIAGQVALFVSGLAMLALTSRRAVAAGVCFGLAATIKPQALLLLPLALIGAREYRVLGFAVLTGGALALVDLATHGMLWLDWLRATGRFADLLPLMGSALNGASPTGLVTHRHLEGGIAAAIVATGVALGTTTTWFVFRRTSDPAHRAAALGIGYILCSPYAAVYELTMMAPAAAAILLDRRQQPLTWFGAAFGLSTLGGAMAPMTFGAALLCERLRSRKPSVIPAQAGISLPDRQDQRQWDSSLRWDDRAT